MEKNSVDNGKHPVAVSEKASKRSRVFRWVKRTVLALLLVAILPFLVFQIPFVQNFAAQKLTKFLSKELNTTVSVEKVWLGIFHEINLESLYLEDLQGDTLLLAGELDVDHGGLYQLMFRELSIESLVLRNATINPKLENGKENFQFIVDYFSKEQKEQDYSYNQPFILDVQHILLENIDLYRKDEAKGENIDAHIGYLETHIDRFDLNAKRIELAYLQILSPDVMLEKYQGTAPETDEAEPQLVTKKLELNDTSGLLITIVDFDIKKGDFSLRNRLKEPEKLTPPGVLNFNYLDAFDINVAFNNLSITDELEFHGQVEGISMQDSTGFVLENLSAEDATLTCEGLELLGMELRTPQTVLGDTLIFRYSSYYDWESFVDEVRMDLRFSEDAYVSLHDIMTFASKLQDNIFFQENENEVVKLTGRIRGPVNRLDGRNLVIDLAQGVRIEGNFSTLNLAVKDEQFLHLELDRMLTRMSTLRKLIPNFNPPENFDRLGRLDFSGNFDGFFVDFVADGKLRCDIGTASMFMNMKLRDGRENAIYLGELGLQNFDLGAWSSDPNLGRVTTSVQVKEGVGLTLNSASAKLEGVIDSLEFKGYDYTNVALNGELEKNRFKGNVVIQDENADLSFDGQLDFQGEVPAYDFTADIQQLSLQPLNIAKRDLQFSGHVEMSLQGTRLSDVVGGAKVTDFQVIKNHADTLLVESALVTSTISPDSLKEFKVASNLGNVDFNGRFDIEKIPNKFTEFVTTNYPGFADRMGLVLKDTIPDTMDFAYRVELFELQNLFSFFEEKLRGFDQSIVSGEYDGAANKFSMEIEVPEWSYGNIAFDDVYFRTKLSGDEGQVQVGVVETDLGNGRKLSPVSLIGSVYADTLEFLVISSNFFKILDNVNINGVLSLEDSTGWRVSFKPSDLVVMNQTWAIDTANFIRIGGGKVETNNFQLFNGDQLISLTSVRDEGLELRVKNVPLQSIDFIKNFEKHHFDGVADLHFKAKDIFRFEGLEALLRIDELTVNGDNYGVLRLDASAAGTKETVSSFLTIDGDSTSFVLDGYFNPPKYEPRPQRKWTKNESNYFDFDVSFEKIPVSIVQYFVADISDVKGVLNAKDIHLFGKIDKPRLDGLVQARGISFTINPLQTTYRVPLDTVRLTSRLVDATGALVYDRFGHTAKLEGGLTHENLRNWGLDLYIRTQSNKGFLGLETTELDNPIFYGTAIGEGYARFTGTFKQSELYVNGRTSPGTYMYLPLTGTTAAESTGFVTFTEELRKVGGDTLLPTELRGLNMEYDLTITEDAQMEVIFDKSWGDVLKGTGTGDLKVIMERNGRFDMYGEYEVVSGDYLFTLMNLGLNKPFTVEPGGTVTWAGDPYEATINVNAVYEGAKASVGNFVGEYLAAASENAQNLAQTPTAVDLKMNLTGSLLKPDIGFEIEFPQLDSELRGYAENKMRTIRQDPNELNRQVFGLLVLGQFMPSGYTLQAGDVGLNTLSEMLSNQLSIYVTEFVSELLVGTNFIEGIDFDVSYNRFSTTSLTDANIITGDELNFRTKVRLSNRLSLSGGVEVGVGGGTSLTTNTGQTTGDIQIEYAITQDRRLKIKGYILSEPDIGGGIRQKAGAGISFRKEFDSISELVSFRNKKKKKG